MKQLMIALLMLAALFCVGCAVPTGKSGTLYQSPPFGDRVGNIIWVEDPDHGTLIYKYVMGTGKGEFKVLVKDGSDWKLPEE